MKITGIRLILMFIVPIFNYNYSEFDSKTILYNTKLYIDEIYYIIKL